MADEVCCRTCENDWTSVIAILLGFLGTVVLAVIYGELCTSKKDQVRVEFEDSKHKVQVKAGAEMAEIAQVEESDDDKARQSDL